MGRIKLVIAEKNRGFRIACNASPYTSKGGMVPTRL